MDICSIPFVFRITDVKAYYRLSFSKAGIQSRQYAKVWTTGPCLVYFTFSSRAPSIIVLFADKTDKYI